MAFPQWPSELEKASSLHNLPPECLAAAGSSIACKKTALPSASNGLVGGEADNGAA
jgi:hypothetical protein